MIDFLGDENSQVAVCVTGFDDPHLDPSTGQQPLQQLSAPIQVSDPFPPQDGDMYFPPPDLATFLAAGGGTPRSRLPINTQQSYPPDEKLQPAKQMQPRWNAGAAPAPPPRIGHPLTSHHQHSHSDGGVTSPPPPPPPRTSPPKVTKRIFSSQEDIFHQVKNNNNNHVPHRHSGGYVPSSSSLAPDAISYVPPLQQQSDVGDGGQSTTFSTFKPRLHANFHPPSTASSSGVSSWGSSSSFQGVGMNNAPNVNDISPSRSKVTFLPMASPGAAPLPPPPPSSSTSSTPTTPLATQVSTPTMEGDASADEKRLLEFHVMHIGEQRAYEKGD